MRHGWSVALAVAMFAAVAGCARWSGPYLGPVPPYSDQAAHATAVEDSVAVEVDTGGPVDVVAAGLTESGLFCAQVRANAVARQIWCRGTYLDRATSDDRWADTVDIVATPDGQLQYLRVNPPERLDNTAGAGLSANADTDGRLISILKASLLRLWPDDTDAANNLISEVRRASRGVGLGHDSRDSERAKTSTAHADYYVGEGDYFSKNFRTTGHPPLTFIAATNFLAGPWPTSSAHSLVDPVAAAPGLEAAGFDCPGPDKNPCNHTDHNEYVTYWTVPRTNGVAHVEAFIAGGTSKDGGFTTIADVGYAHGLTFLTDAVRPAIEDRIEQARRDDQPFLGIVAGTVVRIDARPTPVPISGSGPVTVAIGVPLVGGF